MEIKRPVKWAIIGGLLGGAVGAAYFLAKRHKELGNVNPHPNAEIAYTYEEAVAKAKAKMEEGEYDGVKLMPHVDVPDLDEAPEVEEAKQKVAYNKMAERYSTEENESGTTIVIDESSIETETAKPEETVEVEPDPLAGIEPWPEEKVGKYIRISEDKFRYENPFNTKLLGAYFPKDGKIGGWDDKLEPVEDDELIGRMHAICSSEEFDGDTCYFSDPDGGIDYEIEINEYRWQEAYDDYKQSA